MASLPLQTSQIRCFKQTLICLAFCIFLAGLVAIHFDAVREEMLFLSPSILIPNDVPVFSNYSSIQTLIFFVLDMDKQLVRLDSTFRITCLKTQYQNRTS
jgi:hypothetical protein